MLLFRKYFFILFLFKVSGLSARLPDLIPYRSGSNWGYCDSTKKMIIEPKYREAYPFYGNTAVVETWDFTYSLIDRSGSEIHPHPDALNIFPEAHHGLRIAWNRSLDEGLIDEKGNFLFVHQQKFMYWLCDTFLITFDHNGTDLYDCKGKNVKHFDKSYFIYGWDINGNTGQFIAGRKHKQGVIDMNGNTPVPFRYDHVESIAAGTYLLMKGDSMWYTDLHGKVIRSCACASTSYMIMFGRYCNLPDSLDNDDPFISNRWQTFKKHGKYGMKDADGKVMIEPKYSYIYSFGTNGLSQVTNRSQQGNKRKKLYGWGYIDIYGNEYWDGEPAY